MVDSAEDLSNVKMSRAGKGQERVTRNPHFGKKDCQGCKGKDTLCKSGSGLWCTRCGMRVREQTQLQGKQANGEDKVPQENITLQSTKEAAIPGGVTGIDTSEGDQGKSGKDEIAQTRAKRREAKEREKDRKWAEKMARVKAENENYARKVEREAVEQGAGKIQKVIAEHGVLPRRAV